MHPWPRILVIGSILLAACLPTSSAGSTPPELDRATRLTMEGNVAGALAEYEAFLSRSPHDRLAPVAAMAAANIELTALGDTTAAERRCDRILADYRDSDQGPLAARQKGACAQARRDWPAAGEAYQTAVELASAPGRTLPTSWIAETVTAAAECFYRAADPDRVIRTYRAVLGADPSPEVAATARYRLGEALESTGDSAGAAASYRAVVESYPSSPQFPQAVAKRPLIDRHSAPPLDWTPYTLFLEGTRLIDARRYDAALRNADSTLALTRDPRLRECAEYRVITIETMQRGDYREGCRRLAGLLDAYPNGLRTDMARRQLALWTPIGDLEARVETGPADAATLRSLGGQYLNVRAGSRAVAVLEKAVSLAPEDPDAHLLLGYGYAMTNRDDEALRAFQFYLARNPTDASVLNMVGYNLLGRGQADNAILYFQKYAELAPEDPNAHDSLGEGYLGAGRLEDSAAEYEKAVALDPSFANSWFMLGGIYRRTGRTERSLAAYGRFLDLNAEGPQADQARGVIDSLRVATRGGEPGGPR